MTADPKSELADVARSLRLQLEEWSELGAGESAFLPAGPDVSQMRAETAHATLPAARTAVDTPARPNVSAEPPPRQASASTGPVSISEAFGGAPSKAATPKASAAKGPARPLEVIREEVRGCTKCVLSETRTHTVFSRGNPKARLCFIGEAPGADEDAEGIPFVGRAGQLLDKMIGAMGLDPEKDVYVCNIIKCRPPENRKPTPEETATCFPFLHEQLAVVEPRVIVALGNTAMQGLLETKVGITKMRGQWKLYRGQILVMPTYHPSYLLRPSAQQAAAKREAWEDLQTVMKELGLELPKKKA